MSKPMKPAHPEPHPEPHPLPRERRGSPAPTLPPRPEGWSGPAGAFLRFVLVGGAATALHYGLYLLFVRWMPATPAYAVGYTVSFVANFYATARFTFRSAPTWGRLAGMAGAHGVNFALHLGLLNLFLWMGLATWLAPMPVYAVAIPVNFILVRYVFKS